MNGLRLLPWSDPDGKPCYLATDDGTSPLSRRADEIEALQVSMRRELLGHARALLGDCKADARELRFLAERPCEALRDVLRVAERAEAGACPHPTTDARPIRTTRARAGAPPLRAPRGHHDRLAGRTRPGAGTAPYARWRARTAAPHQQRRTPPRHHRTRTDPRRGRATARSPLLRTGRPAPTRRRTRMPPAGPLPRRPTPVLRTTARPRVAIPRLMGAGGSDAALERMPTRSGAVPHAVQKATGRSDSASPPGPRR